MLILNNQSFAFRAFYDYSAQFYSVSGFDFEFKVFKWPGTAEEDKTQLDCSVKSSKSLNSIRISRKKIEEFQIPSAWRLMSV